MSNGTRTKQERSNKVRALEEVVGLLKKHVQHRELEINDLGSRLRQSNDKIRNLEKKLDQKNTVRLVKSKILLKPKANL